MSATKIPVDRLAKEVMEGLQEYADLASDELKKAVKKSSTKVKNDIQAKAPERTGRYKKSWTTKKTKETSNSLVMTVYSPSRYMLTHLLEHGHAKRGGGRVRAIPHIAPAEAAGEKELLSEIERALK